MKVIDFKRAAELISQGIKVPVLVNTSSNDAGWKNSGFVGDYLDEMLRDVIIFEPETMLEPVTEPVPDPVIEPEEEQVQEDVSDNDDGIIGLEETVDAIFGSLRPEKKRGAKKKFDAGKIAAMYEQGMSVGEIAAELGCVRNTVLTALKAKGIDYNNR